MIDWSGRTWAGRYPGEAARLLTLGGGPRRRTGQTLLLDGTDPGFDARRVLVREAEEPFRLDAAVARRGQEAVAAFASDASVPFFDGAVARLAGIRGAERGERVLVWQRAGYFDYARSNLALDWPGQGPSLRERLHADGRLGEVGAPHMADAIGVTVLLETVDGRLVLQRRSHSVRTWPGVWAGSASGMIEPADLDGADTLADLQPLREAEEELGLGAAVLAATPLRFLGITRELARGGAPEMFFHGRLPVGAAAIEAALLGAEDRHEVERILFADLHDPGALFDRLVSEGAADTLLGGLVLLARALAPDAAQPCLLASGGTR
jgi:hypothetical protein